jgi:translation initiation factor eIF-2B subunit delta
MRDVLPLSSPLKRYFLSKGCSFVYPERRGTDRLQVIQAYTTPPGIALSRHLTTHLSHQITHLSHSRPLSVSQGNAIRWLKKLISSLDPDRSDSDAIAFLCTSIDGFIREKITLADEVIARKASAKIESGDIVLTHAKSSVVEKTLLAAHAQGKMFKVIVTDSRPLFEGKNLARSLSAAGLETQYCSVSGLSSVIWQVTKCFLGASAMMGNGQLYSRTGTALVAMTAKGGSGPSGRKAPVIVLCESIKFTGRVALDSVVNNELDSPDTLIEYDDSEVLTQLEALLPPSGSKGAKKGDKGATDDGDPAEAKSLPRGLQGWAEQPGLHLVSLMYDVTPAECLDMVITELGTLPPSAVPVVNGVWGGES